MAKQADKEKLLDKLYNSLIGVTFRGSYEGVQQMHDKEWQLLDIQDGEAVIKTLQSIRKIAEGYVWKGFTGPEDSYCGKDWDYRLYVDLEDSDTESREYEIIEVQRFSFRKKSFEYKNDYGYAITVRGV